MSQSENCSEHGCTCSSFSRRRFLEATAAAAGLAAMQSIAKDTALQPEPGAGKKEPARVRVAFLYPPSKIFADDPDGWWSWPGNEFDAEGRQKTYTEQLRIMEKKLSMRIDIDQRPVATDEQVRTLANEISAGGLDGLLLVMFYNNSLNHADALLKAAEQAGLPAVFYIGLGVKHGRVDTYRCDGVYLIQSMDNFDAIEYGLRMIAAKKCMSQTRLLSITDTEQPRDGVEQFLGTTVRGVPFAQYAQAFQEVRLDAAARDWIETARAGAREIRGVSDEAFTNAARAHFALIELLRRHGAAGLTMNCLRRGMLKPCLSFSALNSQLIPAACENDFNAMYTQMLGQLLLERPGFQHNPCYETERNHYYASHCTCPPRMYGPQAEVLPYLLRRFAHTNEGSCAIQVFWKPGDPVTMVRYYGGQSPRLDVYSARVIASHQMPPAAGCTTNVEIEITDRPDACMVKGHHNLLFCGDNARKFTLFAKLYKMQSD